MFEHRALRRARRWWSTPNCGRRNREPRRRQHSFCTWPPRKIAQCTLFFATNSLCFILRSTLNWRSVRWRPGWRWFEEDPATSRSDNLGTISSSILMFLRRFLHFHQYLSHLSNIFPSYDGEGLRAPKNFSMVSRRRSLALRTSASTLFNLCGLCACGVSPGPELTVSGRGI